MKKSSASKDSGIKTLESFFSSNLTLIGLFLIVLFLVVYLMFDKMMLMDDRLRMVEKNGNGSKVVETQ